jgi:SAM-dependent methyltransferase
MSKESFDQMRAFYELDLEELQFSSIPDAHFDAVLIVHVIEHLTKAPAVAQALCKKVKPGGIIYIEWPHPRSLHLPSMRESLNFNDDPTHVKLWEQKEIEDALTAEEFRIIRQGSRRNWWYLAFSPVVLPYRAWRRGYISGPDLWDHLGFAQFILAEKYLRE